ncbi:MAG: hypothetical protein HY901_24315, partial [Deltaproteobacteria bacterium]|nr:hypothetical protein [Deltaproteobacteria bacterium]
MLRQSLVLVLLVCLAAPVAGYAQAQAETQPEESAAERFRKLPEEKKE